MNDFEKRWQRISELLSQEITGNERPMVSSGRTLFGIKSSVEEKMERFAKEIEEEQTLKRKAALSAQRGEETDSSPSRPDDGTAFHAEMNGISHLSIDELTQRALDKAIEDARKAFDDAALNDPKDPKERPERR